MRAKRLTISITYTLQPQLLHDHQSGTCPQYLQPSDVSYCMSRAYVGSCLHHVFAFFAKMESAAMFVRLPLAHTCPENSRRHSATLMREFATIMLTMNNISQPVTEGVSRTMETLPGDTNRELELKSLAQNLTRELSSSLSLGVPRPIFDALYQSFSGAEFQVGLQSRSQNYSRVS